MNAVIVNEQMTAKRTSNKTGLATYMQGMDIIDVDAAVDWFKTQDANITQGDIHQAFIDNGISLSEPPKNPQES